jgi:eukaryotic-like serine/threonine-protein kinase
VPLAAGSLLNHYRVIRPLGAGGMGEVYEAEDMRLKRSVALKILPEDVAFDPNRRTRFQREAHALASMNHPNIVSIHSIEESGGTYFLTMELIDGRNLAEIIPPPGLRLSEFLQYAIPLVEAVSAAHQRGVIHRDLKPANVMIASGERVKVLDFGIAKLRRSTRAATAVLAGEATLTLAETASGDITDERRIFGMADAVRAA